MYTMGSKNSQTESAQIRSKLAENSIFYSFSENNLIKTNFTPAEKSPQQNHSPESSVDDRGLDLLLDMCSPHCLFSACFIFFSPQLQNYDLSSGLSNLEEFLVFFHFPVLGWFE